MEQQTMLRDEDLTSAQRVESLSYALDSNQLIQTDDDEVPNLITATPSSNSSRSAFSFSNISLAALRQYEYQLGLVDYPEYLASSDESDDEITLAGSMELEQCFTALPMRNFEIEEVNSETPEGMDSSSELDRMDQSTPTSTAGFEMDTRPENDLMEVIEETPMSHPARPIPAALEFLEWSEDNEENWSNDESPFVAEPEWDSYNDVLDNVRGSQPFPCPGMLD
jgi:hypothetical protein